MISNILLKIKVFFLNKKIKKNELTFKDKLDILNNPSLNQLLDFPTIELILPKNIIIKNTNNIYFEEPLRIGSASTLFLTSGKNSYIHLNPNEFLRYNSLVSKHYIQKLDLELAYKSKSLYINDDILPLKLNDCVKPACNCS